MSVDVVISPVGHDRMTVGDQLSVDTVNEHIATLKREAEAPKSAHDKWLAEAKTKCWQGPDDAAILAAARTNLEAARKLKNPVDNSDDQIQSRWKTWAERIYQETKTFATCREALHYAQSKIPFDHRTTVKPDTSEFEQYACLVNDEFPNLFNMIGRLEDNPASIPETLYLYNGRLVSNVFFWHFRNMLFCHSHVPELRRILEIGGGYGNLARLWLKNPEAKIERYVIVDLPEALFFSEVALRSEFGDQVGYWNGSDPDTRVVLVPVGRLAEYVKPSDLVINVGSFQEMSDVWITYYMGWLDRYQAKFFYSLNYMGAPLEFMFESRNFWSPRPSNLWSTRVLHPDVPLIKTMCAGRSFVEILYEKIKSQASFAKWSVFNGSFFDRTTYLEGLELLRQDCSAINAKLFINIVMQHVLNRKFLLPKEIFSVATAVDAAARDSEFSKFVKFLDDMKKQACY